MVQRDIGVNRLALDVMRDADHRRFGDFRVGNQGRLDFGGAQTVTGDVKHVIDTASDPVIAVFITACAVTAEIHAFKGGEVGLFETIVVAEQRSSLAWPGVGDHQVAFTGALLHSADIIDQCRLNTEERPRSGTGFQLGGTGQRSDHKAAGFGLPPGVDDRAFSVADFIVIPLPGFRVDRFADRTHDAQRIAFGPFDRLVTFGHQGTNGGRGGIQDIDLVLVDHL
ncbi:hypothetical protein D3C78_870830 [compost metagenome]